jgi:demethylmenaquinone methyltransferase/2-methoxy-6-polyprenyl-1,4-benzoquinol methylase
MSERETRRNSLAGESRNGESDFGFRRVPETEKAPLVRAVFDSVAGRYDLMND